MRSGGCHTLLRVVANIEKMRKCVILEPKALFTHRLIRIIFPLNVSMVHKYLVLGRSDAELKAVNVQREGVFLSAEIFNLHRLQIGRPVRLGCAIEGGMWYVYSGPSNLWIFSVKRTFVVLQYTGSSRSVGEDFWPNRPKLAPDDINVEGSHNGSQSLFLSGFVLLSLSGKRWSRVKWSDR